MKVKWKILHYKSTKFYWWKLKKHIGPWATRVEIYQFWDQLRRRLIAKTPEEPVAALTLPEWPSFIQLVRACMDCPLELSIVPIILKELAFQYLQEQISLGDSQQFIKELALGNPQASKCAILIVDYIVKASRIPAEFANEASAYIMKLQRPL